MQDMCIWTCIHNRFSIISNCFAQHMAQQWESINVQPEGVRSIYRQWTWELTCLYPLLVTRAKVSSAGWGNWKWLLRHRQVVAMIIMVNFWGFSQLGQLFCYGTVYSIWGNHCAMVKQKLKQAFGQKHGVLQRFFFCSLLKQISLTIAWLHGSKISDYTIHLEWGMWVNYYQSYSLT